MDLMVRWRRRGPNSIIGNMSGAETLSPFYVSQGALISPKSENQAKSSSKDNNRTKDGVSQSLLGMRRAFR